MRILFYSHAYPGPMGHQAGGETTAHSILTHLVSQGHEVGVLLSEVTEGVPSYDIDGITVRTNQTAADKKNLPFQYFPHADVVVTQLGSALRGSLVARMAGKPVVNFAHNAHPHTKKMIQSNTHLAVYNTKFVSDKLKSEGVGTPSVICRPPVDPEKYRVDRTGECITLINLSDGDPFYDKGYKTFYELARRYPHLPFLGVKGAYSNQHVEELDNVTIIEHTTDIASVYRQTKVLLVPSKQESFGRVAVEAAASGIPTLMSDVEGTRESAGVDYLPYDDHDSWDASLLAVHNQYDFYSEIAKRRSRELWEQSQEELYDVEIAFNILREDGYDVLRDYLNL